MYDLVNFDEAESLVTGKINMSLMPAFADSGVVSATNNGSMGFAVAAQSPVKEAGWEYVKYLTSEDVQNRYSAHLLPVWESSFEGESLDKLMSYTDSAETTVPMFKEQFPYSVVRPKVPFYPEASKALQLALQEALTGQKTPQQALDDAAAKWVSLMGE
jgi:multiple sugar transport system substrate-binding protein